jgi:hypothetical protein
VGAVETVPLLLELRVQEPLFQLFDYYGLLLSHCFKFCEHELHYVAFYFFTFGQQPLDTWIVSGLFRFFGLFAVYNLML